jgi:two-component system response regulator HydG
VVDVTDLPEEVRRATIRDVVSRAIATLVQMGTPVAEVERRMLHETLRVTGGSKPRAAQLPGIDVRTVARQLERQEDEAAETATPD